MSLVRYYPSSNIPLPFTKWKYKYPSLDWMTLIISYLRNGTLPEDYDASHRLKLQSSRLVMMGDVLYKRGLSRSYLRYLIPDETDYVMKEVHEGICRNHSGACSLVYKLIQAGYY